MKVLVSNQVLVEMEFQHVLGIIAVYHELNIPHPLTMYGHHFNYESTVVQKHIITPHNTFYDYQITVAGHLYGFRDTKFLQGLVTAAMWLGISPQSFITKLRRLRDIYDTPSGIPNLGEQYSPRNPTIIVEDLQYY